MLATSNLGAESSSSPSSSSFLCSLFRLKKPRLGEGDFRELERTALIWYVVLEERESSDSIQLLELLFSLLVLLLLLLRCT